MPRKFFARAAASLWHTQWRGPSPRSCWSQWQSWPVEPVYRRPARLHQDSDAERPALCVPSAPKPANWTYTVFMCTYTSLHCISWALLWKPDFLRIVTSYTRRYILWCTVLCPFIAVSYYSMVGRDITQCYCFHSWVHTIMSLELKSMYWEGSWMYHYVVCTI